MRFNSRLCLLTLCAFALLLGLMTAGCSSQDREGSKQAATTKTITYGYTKSSTTGVPSTAEYIYVKAYDANNNELYAALQNNDEHDAWAGYDESSSTYNAVTVVDTKTDHMLYTFTYTDEESGSEVEIYTDMVSDVTGIEDGGTAKDPSEVKFTCKFYGSDGKELPADKVTVDDQFSVRVFAKVDIAEQDVSDSFDSLTFAPTELLEEGTAGTYTAKSEGTVKFTAEVEDVEYQDIGSITIVPKEVPGGPALYLCPAGYSVVEGKLYDNASAEVTDPESIPEEISGVYFKDDLGDTPYTFVVVLRQEDGAYVDCAGSSPSLSVSPSEGISFAGCKMNLATADEVGYDQHFVSAKVGGYETAFPLNFTPAKYAYNGYICPRDYYVADNELFDQDGNSVDLNGIPDELTLTNGDTYTFASALMNREGTLLNGPADCFVSSSHTDVVKPKDHSMQVDATGEGVANLWVDQDQSYTIMCKNSITVTVEAAPRKIIYICPTGYYVESGKLYNDKKELINDPITDIPNDLTVKVEESYEFVLVSYNDSAETWDYYTIAGTGNSVLIYCGTTVVASSSTSGTLNIPYELQVYGGGIATIGFLRSESEYVPISMNEFTIHPLRKLACPLP